MATSGRRFSLGRLLGSSTFRLAFLGALLFTVTSVALLAAVKVMTGSLLDRRVDLSVDGEIDRLRQIVRQGGRPALINEIEGMLASLQARQRVYLLVDTSGRVLAGNLDEWPRAPRGRHMTFSVPPRFDDSGSRVRGTVMDLGAGGRLFVGRIQDDRVVFDRVVTYVMLGGVALSVALGLVCGLLLARHAVHRLDGINATIDSILGDRMDGRVALGGSGDEFDMLAANLNRMLDRIDGLLAAMRNVTRNIAHDLRTPLNRLRNRLELALLAKGDGEGPELSAALKDVDAIIATFNALLVIARVEGRVPGEQFTELEVGRILEDVAELYRPLAEDAGLDLEVSLPGPLTVRGDGRLLFQALANLVDNAIKYAAGGHALRLLAATRDDRVELVVADHGPGIPAADRAEVLRPFVRLDASRHRPGAGLGLSLVAAIVGLHRARLDLADNHPGLRAAIVFPPLSQTGR